LLELRNSNALWDSYLVSEVGIAIRRGHLHAHHRRWLEPLHVLLMRRESNKGRVHRWVLLLKHHLLLLLLLLSRRLLSLSVSLDLNSSGLWTNRRASRDILIVGFKLAISKLSLSRIYNSWLLVIHNRSSWICMIIFGFIDCFFLWKI
jgi:hypothetical protein